MFIKKWYSIKNIKLKDSLRELNLIRIFLYAKYFRVNNLTPQSTLMQNRFHTINLGYLSFKSPKNFGYISSKYPKLQGIIIL